MRRELPILYVTHDEEDGMWQFLDGGDASEEDARILSLKEIVAIDPSLAQLADLPLGGSHGERAKIVQGSGRNDRI
jgi:hypothetical protein